MLAHQPLESIIEVLDSLISSEFAEILQCYPRPYSAIPDNADFVAFTLPSVLVPPEIIEVDGVENSGHIKMGDESPQCVLKLFDDDVRISLLNTKILADICV